MPSRKHTLVGLAVVGVGAGVYYFGRRMMKTAVDWCWPTSKPVHWAGDGPLSPPPPAKNEEQDVKEHLVVVTAYEMSAFLSAPPREIGVVFEIGNLVVLSGITCTGKFAYVDKASGHAILPQGHRVTVVLDWKSPMAPSINAAGVTFTAWKNTQCGTHLAGDALRDWLTSALADGATLPTFVVPPSLQTFVLNCGKAPPPSAPLMQEPAGVVGLADKT